MKKEKTLLEEYEALVEMALESSNDDVAEFPAFLIRGINSSEKLKQALFVVNFWMEDDNKKVTKAFKEYALGKDIVSVLEKHNENYKFSFDLATATNKYSSN